MLVQRRKRWANNKPTLVQRLVFCGRTTTCNARMRVKCIRGIRRVYYKTVLYTSHRGGGGQTDNLVCL